MLNMDNNSILLTGLLQENATLEYLAGKIADKFGCRY